MMVSVGFFDLKTELPGRGSLRGAWGVEEGWLRVYGLGVSQGGRDRGGTNKRERE
jgi:hypothetical protein